MRRSGTLPTIASPERRVDLRASLPANLDQWTRAELVIWLEGQMKEDGVAKRISQDIVEWITGVGIDSGVAFMHHNWT